MWGLQKFDITKCGRCELIDNKLKLLQSSFTCDGNITESGIEDLGSSADSSLEVVKFCSLLPMVGFFCVYQFSGTSYPTLSFRKKRN